MERITAKQIVEFARAQRLAFPQRSEHRTVKTVSELTEDEKQEFYLRRERGIPRHLILQQFDIEYNVTILDLR